MNIAAKTPVPGDGAFDPQWVGGRGRLTQSLRLEEQGPGRAAAISIVLILLLIVGFIAWAAVVRVDEIAPASGEVTPIGSVKRIQHLEGGIISAINVQEGDMVDRGQILLTLESGMSAPELNQLKTRLAALQLQATQLRAIANPKDGKVDDTSELGDVAAAQKSLLESKRASVAKQEAVLVQQRQQIQAKLDSQQEQQKSISEQIAALEEQIGIRDKTFKLGYTTRVKMLELQRDLAQIKTDLAAMEGQIIFSKEQIAEIDARIAELHAKANLDASQEIGNVISEIAEIREAIEKAQDRVKRLTVRAPVRGVVKGLQTETVGGVVAPGSTLLEIIPSDADLIVEARVLPKDIGFVNEGQYVFVKVGTYDYARFGGIEGRIKTISATTFQDDEGENFYRARIHLDRNYVGNDPDKNRVIPGMTVVADIHTGEKSILESLLHPLVRASDEALRER